MKCFKLNDMVSVNVPLVLSSDLDEPTKTFVKTKKNDIFRVVEVSEEDEKDLYKIADKCGVIIPTGLYYEELIKGCHDWDL